MTRIFFVFLWLLHWLPLPFQAAVGWIVGHLLFLFVLPRRRVALINLRLCFPELSALARLNLARKNFVAITSSFLGFGVLWWGSAKRLRRIVSLEGLEHLQAAQAGGKPVLLMVPHFVGMDMAGMRLGLEHSLIDMYSAQKNKALENMLAKKRGRFGTHMLISRQDGIRAAIKAMKKGFHFFYMPDMDYGERDAVFAPFFGVKTATITGLSRVARLAGAVVVPYIVTMLPFGQGYRATLHPAWTDFPSDDPEADTHRMNAFIEAQVRLQPATYYWVHKRFKTRPPGEARFY